MMGPPMEFTRRQLITASAGAAAIGCSSSEPAAPPPETAKTHEWKLRYAPKMSMLGDEASVQVHMELYHDYGFRAFEYNRLYTNHTLEESETLRKRMDDLDMEMGVFVVNSQGWKGDALVDKKFHAGFLADVEKSIEYHKVMRNKWCTVTTGLSVDYMSIERQTANVIDGIKRAVDMIQGLDLTLVLEPLNVLVNHPGYHVVTSEHAARIVDGVGSDQFKILFDIYHQQISEGNLINNIEKHWDRIGYFQAGDVPGRKEPGTGEIRYSQVFRRIYELGYQGVVGMEHGLSQPGRAGLDRCFEEYRKADSWDAAG